MVDKLKNEGLRFRYLVEEKSKKIKWQDNTYYVINKSDKKWSEKDIKCNDWGEFLDNNDEVLGLFHRVGGPAVISNDTKTKEWWFRGKLHRTDGPAAIYYNQNGRQEEFWVRGRYMDRKEFLRHFEIKSEE